MFGLFTNSGKRISPKDAKENLEKDKSIVLLDVREGYEYKNGHIRGSKNIPVGQVATSVPKLNISKDATIYVYCQSGARAGSAVSALTKLGYTNVSNLGGIMSWPYEVVR